MIECVNISIIDDDVVDNTTTFTVILSSEDSTVRVTQGRVNVNVLDNGESFKLKASFPESQ